MAPPPSPELLAPGGSPEAAIAALTYGASGVYVGLSRFSARAEAGNFSADSLDELIGYAHSLDRRVYVAVNTLVQEQDLSDVLDTLGLLQELAVDAIIVQDMGVAHLARTRFPSLRLHASTQLAVHNLPGAKLLKNIGFSRVVLARELDLKEIARITGHCGIETEVFIHGALCYSYSGLCLLSSHLLGRSGNRGRCAYCCRQPFRDHAGREHHPFALKDLSRAAYLPDLLQANVTSLKIEGRMRGPVYVAAVTDAYRRLLDGTLSEVERRRFSADLQTIFYRSTTDLNLRKTDENPFDADSAGHRGAFLGTVQSLQDGWMILHSNREIWKHDGLTIDCAAQGGVFGFAADQLRLATDPEQQRRFELPAETSIAVKLPSDAPDITRGASVYCLFSQAVRQRYPVSMPRPGDFRRRHPARIHIALRSGRLVLQASATCRGTAIAAEIELPDAPSPARQPEKTRAAMQRCFDRLGDTEWTCESLSFAPGTDALFVPLSSLNEHRRRLMADLSAAREIQLQGWHRDLLQHLSVSPAAENAAQPAAGDTPQARPAATPSWSLKIRTFQDLDPAAYADVDEIILEVDPRRRDDLDAAIAALPPEKLRLALPVIIRDAEQRAYHRLIDSLPQHHRWEAANLGSLQMLQGKGDIIADWPLYTLNTLAAREWQNLGVRSCVLSPEDDARNLRRLLAVLGETAVVILYQHTPLMLSATAPATHGSTVSDRSGRTFHLHRHHRDVALTCDEPFCLAAQQRDLQDWGARHFRIDLSYGNPVLRDAATLVRRLLAGESMPGYQANYNRGLS